MRYVALFAALIAAPLAAQTTTTVKPHIRKDGTFVSGHQRTTPNSTVNDNWSTSPNVNPWTGKTGTKPPAPAYPALPKPKKN